MTRLERNRQQAAAIVTRIERNIEISQLCHAGQLIKTGQFDKRSLQALISDLLPKRENHNA